jgi:hypothetical protein
VDGQHGDAQHRLVNFDQLVLQPAALTHQHASCKAQIPVKPCVPEAASVSLYVDRLAAAAARPADGLDLHEGEVEGVLGGFVIFDAGCRLTCKEQFFVQQMQLQ